MKPTLRHLILVAACLPAPGALGHPVHSKVIIGATEMITIQNLNYRLTARIDTGATNSSLHAEQIAVFSDRDNQKRVRFTVRDADGMTRDFSLPLLRMTSIKRHQHRTEIRPVVTLAMCLGGIHRHVDATLVDRTGLSYPLLIGRSFLSGYFLVDVSLKNTQKVECGSPRLPTHGGPETNPRP